MNRLIYLHGDAHLNCEGAQTICSKIRTPVRILSLLLLNKFFQACSSIKSFSYFDRPSSSTENDNGQKASPRKSHLETTSKASTNPTNISKTFAYCQSNYLRNIIFILVVNSASWADSVLRSTDPSKLVHANWVFHAFSHIPNFAKWLEQEHHRCVVENG